MTVIKYIFSTLFVIVIISATFFAQSKSAKEAEPMNENIDAPETLVKNFIKDYFRWNNESSEWARKIDAAEKSELSKIGISQVTNIEESKMSKFAEIKRQTSAEYMKLFPQVTSEYQKIIEKYCRPNYKALNPAFGGESSHDPNNEVIVSVKTIDKKSIIKTRHTNRSKTGDFVSDYEFHLTYDDNRWYLDQIFYVNDEGKFESL